MRTNLIVGGTIALCGAVLFLLPPTLESDPPQYTMFGTIIHWGGLVLGIAGVLLALRRERA